MVRRNGVVLSEVDQWVTNFVASNPDASGNQLVDTYQEQHRSKANPTNLWKDQLQPRVIDLANHGYLPKDWLSKRYRSIFRKAETVEDRETAERQQAREEARLKRLAERGVVVAKAVPAPNLTMEQVLAWMTDEHALEFAEHYGPSKLAAFAEKAEKIVAAKRAFDEQMKAIKEGK